ncbi:biosynthetic-type acetolactate synthase large subunit [Telmatocola sphagniphila]|uniref:Acetolactate synthase n=1 Tax=Telmatocola sphagniphila TaxID=1123043 RepID=A0A8E6BD85_9BACT|nr:biosynthetic-type acetolactate synthase large subunit [Telmatocola sphagniphila]QVL34790.1 biosynthetic-type acetolactate synthase large subunit [Telmatocola sphagniphila]
MAEKKSAETPMNGADILVQSLIRNGVEVVFAYPGGASMPIHQSLTKVQNKIRTILPRNEQGGGFMAHGYARTTGKVGVCLATSGPGATNFVTILADAKMDSIPVIAITGQVSTPVIGTDAFQETPIVEVCRPITKHHYLLQKTEDITRVMKEAFYIATTGRPGPVIIDIPKDLQQKEIIPNWDPPMNLPGYKPFRAAERGELIKILELIRNSKKPFIYGGGGVVGSGASEALKQFASSTGIPVGLTLHGLGGFPADHYLCLQMLGMHGTVYSNMAINEADLLLAFGVRFDDRVTGKLSEFAKHGKIVHIDIDPSELNKNKIAHVGIHGDLKGAVEGLNQLLQEDSFKDLSKGSRYGDWMKQIDKWREEDPMTFNDREDAILPQYAIKRLYEILKERKQLDETIITTGVGQHQMFAAQYFKFNKPRHWVTSGGLGTMGFGLPSAMGAQVAHPSNLVVNIDGDGSFLMNIQELGCAYAEKIPVKTLLLNNQHLGMVVQWEDRFHGSNRGHTYLGAGMENEPYPNFVQIAKGFKVLGKTISSKKDLDAALEEMIDSNGPFVLDVMVPHQEHVLPMIPSGKTVKDIIKV